MTTEFDPKKALSEEIAGLSDVVKVLIVQRRAVEERMTMAEAEMNALMKLEAFAQGERQRKMRVLADLVAQEQKT
jgi:hypothetical protein